MTVVEATVADSTPAVPVGRQRRHEPITDRVFRDGKFFRLGSDKFYVKGVTYGPFAAGADDLPFPSPEQVRRDFQIIRDLNGNCLRIYHNPPAWFMDLAQEMGLKIFLDVAWPKNCNFIGEAKFAEAGRDAVRSAAKQCGNHPAIFAISVVNEIPPDLVRFNGAAKVCRFIDELVAVAKSEAPECLVTFANFPTTEYLKPGAIDFACYNVYLHDDTSFRNYLARLQNIAGDKPLMLGEYGIDTFREYSEEKQAEILARHVRAVFDEGLVGTFIFSFTDEWVVHGWPIEDWKFGIVRKDRTPKPAFAKIKDLFARAPQLFDGELPKMSVIICSYNGASTVESCLRSMERIKYPNFEVLFIDDGSRDHTQEILKAFPWVINIQQKNMGLSHARNVGMRTAKGEILVYTDSDCEADEDWLYFLAVAMKRSGHIGMGGPNLIPDEGSWIADCVAVSPGGPTHVMIDDRTAEHVPGCNMAFYRWAALEINGFDPQYRAAGDDVDFIWRLQHRGYSIGFSPSAQVWHYRRNTIQAYLKQQRGYGTAEALLKYKHPDHFNALGASHWRGKIYGGDQVGVRIGGDVIYHGVFGTGLFQTIYRRPPSLGAMMMMSVEWHLLTGFVGVAGLAFTPLLYFFAAMLLTPVILAITASLQAPMPKHRHWLTRPLIAYLHWRQPITRGWARYAVRLKAKVMNGDATGFRRATALPFGPHEPNVLRYWHRTQDRLVLLEQITTEVQRQGWRQRVDSGWSGWDVEIYGSRYVNVQVTTATENHHDDGLTTLVRVEPKMSKFCIVLLVAGIMLTLLLLIYVWPFSRPAVLIPMAWTTMYLVNRWRVTKPVLGLIDEVAEQAGYYSIYADGHSVSPAEKRRAALEEEEDLEDVTPSIV